MDKALPYLCFMSPQSLYTFSNQTIGEAEFEASIIFDHTHEIFNGHFPEQPVVPGVCLIRIVKDMAGFITGGNVVFKHGSNIKFLNIIDPNQHTEVFLKGSFLYTNENKLVIKASLSKTEVVFFKFKGTFELS